MIPQPILDALEAVSDADTNLELRREERREADAAVEVAKGNAAAAGLNESAADTERLVKYGELLAVLHHHFED